MSSTAAKLETAVVTKDELTKIAKRERAIATFFAELSIAEIYKGLIEAWRKQPRASVADLYNAHETMREQAKGLYDIADLKLKSLVRAWKKNKKAPVDEQNRLDIEDCFRGVTKAFAPGFAHRYKLKLRKLVDTD
jgi:hypothetical protein